MTFRIRRIGTPYAFDYELDRAEYRQFSGNVGRSKVWKPASDTRFISEDQAFDAAARIADREGCTFWKVEIRR